MVLGFKTRFNDGTPTNFVEAILSGRKIHTIRMSYRWNIGMKIHMATGVRTKHYRQFDLKVVIGTQSIVIKPQNRDVWVTGRKMTRKQIKLLAENDGLTVDQFWNWFNSDFEGEIIHWTNFYYKTWR